ncbi:FUSC family protein [Facilibium subflavum]|uniref:FUSC family protein n=1 Tax=Facilibium subflavum TaxID=2219058 RepID=UPI000E649EE2|nr:FUSC family protein [Facilibium subflavum]
MRAHLKHIYNAFRDIQLSPYIFFISCMLALGALVSTEIALLLNLQYVYWAGYACVRILSSERQMTIKRGVMRCLGTFVALIIALICVNFIHSDMGIIILIILLLIISILLAYLFDEYTYFFIMFCVTISLFFYPFITESKTQAVYIITDRLIVTLIGTFIMLLLAVPFLKSATALRDKTTNKFQIKRLKEAVVFSILFIVTLAFTFFLTLPFKNVLLFEQALIGVVAVMSAFEYFHIRHLSILRFSGCLVGLIFPFFLGFLPLNNLMILIIAFLIIMLFGVIQLQSKYISYMGAQANLCFITALYGTTGTLSIQAGVERLQSTGITLLCILFASLLYFIYARITSLLKQR